MASEFENNLQQHLTRYLSGAESLAEFEDWFVPALWEIDQESDRVREQAGTVHIFISELSRGDLTIEEFRNKLAAMIPASHFIPN